jgi:hypothetical protein
MQQTTGHTYTNRYDKVQMYKCEILNFDKQ